eukprot:1780558-Prymnesium_polylepis.1
MPPPLRLRWLHGGSLASGTPTRSTSLQPSSWASPWSSVVLLPSSRRVAGPSLTLPASTAHAMRIARSSTRKPSLVRRRRSPPSRSCRSPRWSRSCAPT